MLETRITASNLSMAIASVYSTAQSILYSVFIESSLTNLNQGKIRVQVGNIKLTNTSMEHSVNKTVNISDIPSLFTISGTQLLRIWRLKR